MKVCVTGASGYIGEHLSTQFDALGCEVVRVVRTKPDAVSGNFVCISDVYNREEWAEAYCGVDVVIHCLGLAHGQHSREQHFGINYGVTKVAFDAAISEGVSLFVYISSLAVSKLETQGNFKQVPGGLPVKSADWYACAKLASERYIKDSQGIEWQIIRPSMVYGRSCPGNLGSLVRWVNKGLPLPMFEGDRSMISIDSLCSVIGHIVKHGTRNEIYELAEAPPISMAQLHQYLEEATGLRIRIVWVPTWLVRMLATLSRWVRPFKLFDTTIVSPCEDADFSPCFQKDVLIEAMKSHG